VTAGLARAASALEVPAQVEPVVGFLSDGTPYFAPIGQIVADDSRVTCHRCGRSFRSVAAHLRSHGWTKAQYCEAFGLERGQSLEGPDTRKLRSVSFSARLVFDPAVRDGSARGRARARNGQLAQEAASAARGRPFPEQRRQRSRTAMSATARMRLIDANRERAAERLAVVAVEVARRHGYADIGQLVRDGLAAGQSLSAISRACGLNKDWMSRHLSQLAPAAATGASAGVDRLDARWLPAIRAIGFADVGSYLQRRHLVEHMSVNAIAGEVGLSFPTVKAALLRHGISPSPHATKRHAARQRATDVAAELGVDSVSEFIESCQAEGWTWRQLAAATGQSVSWLRRQSVHI
jgi:hypothetical protein